MPEVVVVAVFGVPFPVPEPFADERRVGEDGRKKEVAQRHDRYVVVLAYAEML